MAGLFWAVLTQAQSGSGRSFHELENWVVSAAKSSDRTVFPSNNSAFSATAPDESTKFLSKSPAVQLITPPVLCHWSADDLPFFCRVEYKIGLKTPVPIKFRLGSVEYVDWLEGKGETYFLHH
ncbi:MAG: hypothetical protein ABMA02_09475 [Saprospiraceae bacterium]